jgi:conjugal transfer pilus assembly protein TrbC
MLAQILSPLLSPVGLFSVALVVGAIAYACWFAGRARLALVVAVLAGLALAGAAAPTLAQSAQYLVATVQSRTADQAKAAQDLFEAARGKQDRFREPSQAIVEATPGRLKQGFASLEGTAFAGGEQVAALGDTPLPEGVVYVAVSFSMPAGDLRRLGRDAHKAGAELVIRGLVRGSFKETLLAARQVFDDDSLGGVAIDPNVFRAFKVQAVPTFIAASAPVQPCGKGLECVPVAPPHDALSGNISLGEALRLLKANGEAGASAAQSASERLGG